VYFYNYGWVDYGVPTLESVLDMVKVVDFALRGGKVAVHCHAGLGRTGVLIACYLVYSERMAGDEAISHVRAKRCVPVARRADDAQPSLHTLSFSPHIFHSCNHSHLHIPRPGSIQTCSQIEIVQQFELFLCPLWNFYPPTSCEASSTSFTFKEYLQNQSLLLHGAEQANLKYIPKVRCNFPNNGKKTGQYFI